MRARAFGPISKLFFTQGGFVKLQDEYNELLASRPDAVEHLKRAREMGDLSENGYYKASKAKLISIDSRLRYLSNLIKRAEIIESSQSDEVEMGSIVTVSDGVSEKTYMIVGAFEANPMEQKISNVSPLGKELFGKRVGEVVEINAPVKKIAYKIVNIDRF